MTNAIRVYGVGALLLGLVGLAFADFALQWQPVPEGIAHHRQLAYLGAAILIAAGGSLLLARTRVAGSALLCIVYAAWALGLHGPHVFAHPAAVASWLGFCEIMALAAGGLIAFALLTRPDTRRGAAWVRAGQIAFGASLLVFGVSHFVYAKFTASMIPPWIPASLFFAYLTGCGHVAAGIAILAGIWARAGAALLALMFTLFVLVLHVPRVVGSPYSHVEWTMLGIALALSGAAWIVACSFSGTRARHYR